MRAAGVRVRVAGMRARAAGVRGRAGAWLAAGALLLGGGAGAGEVRAQVPSLSGYYLHAAAGMESSIFSDSGVTDVQRLRLMTRPVRGPVRFDLAWETTLTLRSGDVALGRGFEGMEPAAPWLDLQGTLVDRRRVGWIHGLDRLSAAVDLGEGARLTLGRQTVSWATTLFFTPADPFVPFDPADPFREYRSGVDAARLTLFTGPLSEVDLVVRRAPGAGATAFAGIDAAGGEATGDGAAGGGATGSPAGESWTALARGQRLFGGWDVAGWAGVVHDEAAVSVATAGSFGEVGVRGEAVVRDSDDGATVRAAVGVDRLFELLGRDLRAVIELQHDGFGASESDELLGVALSEAAARGELSVLGRDALALNGSWQVTPLTSLSLLTLTNLRDGSTLISPGLERSMADDVSLRLGAFAGLGPGARVTGGLPVLRSEHGATPLIGFAALSWFF